MENVKTQQVVAKVVVKAVVKVMGRTTIKAPCVVMFFVFVCYTQMGIQGW